MRILSATDLSHLLSVQDLVAAIELGLRAYTCDQIAVPARHHMGWPSGTLLLMPAVGQEMLGVKCVTIVPGNASRQIPTTAGLMILMDAETGIPCAILDAGVLTARRTGALGAISIKYMTPADVHSIGVIGTGVQAAWQAISACAVRPIRTIYYVPRSAKSERTFLDMVATNVPEVEITSCRNALELLSRTSVVIAATTSEAPVLPDDAGILTKKHFISVGSFKPTMQELPNSVYRLAGSVIVDSGAAGEEVGDIINAVKHRAISASNVHHLGDLLSGRCTIDVHHTTVFKSVGMALYDLCAAQALFTEAARKGLGSELDW